MLRNPLLFELTLGLLIALADRFAGGDYVTWLRARVVAAVARWPAPLRQAVVWAANARPVVWATLVLAAALALVGPFTAYGPKLAVLALPFAAWRWDGWDAFGGGIDPKTGLQRLGLFERHLLGLPGFVLATVFLASTGWLLTGIFAAVCFVMFAFFATLLGCILAAEERPGVDVNAYIELARGLVLGLLVAAPLC